MTKKGICSLGLVLLLALALVGASIGTAAGAGGDNAVAAKKKKCKKKKKKSSASEAKKKKKCKKKKNGGGSGNGQSPLVRATLSWTGGDANDADLDLFVFDASGGRAGNGADTIANSILSPDMTGTSGVETFTDTTPQPLRAFSFGVCYTVGGSAHTPFTITYITADGMTHTDSQNPGSSFHYDYPGGVPIPAGYCPV
jgi:hypothetical protein